MPPCFGHHMGRMTVWFALNKLWNFVKISLALPFITFIYCDSVCICNFMFCYFYMHWLKWNIDMWILNTSYCFRLDRFGHWSVCVYNNIYLITFTTFTSFFRFQWILLSVKANAFEYVCLRWCAVECVVECFCVYVVW